MGYHLHHCTILVVDDIDDMRQMLKAGLELCGFDVEVACNGREALELLSDGHCDALLTDLYMPEMNGAELVLETRARPLTANLPIIVMTAAFDRSLAATVPADGFLSKPFSFPPLLRMLDRLHCVGNPPTAERG